MVKVTMWEGIRHSPWFSLLVLLFLVLVGCDLTMNLLSLTSSDKRVVDLNLTPTLKTAPTSTTKTNTDTEYTCKVGPSGARSLTFDDNNWVSLDAGSVEWQPSHASIRQLAVALFGFDLNKSTQFVDGSLIKSQTALCALNTLVRAHYGGRKALTVTDADGMEVWRSDGGAAHRRQQPTDYFSKTHIATVNPNDFAEMRTFVKMRIFEIGFGKAATQSIAKYLGHGNSVRHWRGIEEKMLKNNGSDHKLMHGMDAIAFLDFHALFWRELAAVQYPYALYILNFRPNNHWLYSKLKHFMSSEEIRMKLIFPVLDKETMQMLSANMSAAEKHRFEDVFEKTKSIRVANSRISLKKWILRSLFAKTKWEGKRDYLEMSLSVYRSLQNMKYYFYEHICEVLNAFNNEWHNANSSLLFGDIEANDFFEPKLREFIAPFFQRTRGVGRNNWQHKSGDSYNYAPLVEAWGSHLSNLYSEDYDYDECAVSECICRRYFRFDVRLPHSNRSSFKCEHFSEEQLVSFVWEPLSSLLTTHF